MKAHPHDHVRQCQLDSSWSDTATQMLCMNVDGAEAWNRAAVHIDTLVGRGGRIWGARPCGARHGWSVLLLAKFVLMRSRW